jgi:outer membrane protein TolC
MLTDRWIRRFAREGLVLLPLLAACSSDPIALAPSSPDTPWRIPPQSDTASSLAGRPSAGGAGDAGQSSPTMTAGAANAKQAQRPADAVGDKVTVERNRDYDLAALIDLAQRSNPQTREAWERARQAALAVGLVESAYAPQLSAEALAGYQRTPLPIPPSVFPQGFFTAETRELVPSLAIKWLLFDFGRRQASERSARENSFVANVAFTGAHQKLIFAVSRSYYALSAARGRLHAAERGLKTAELDRDAVQARRSHGLATTVELAKAQRQYAQARFTLERAAGTERTAYAALLASVGLEPTSEIRIAEGSEQALPGKPPGDVGQYVAQALSNRPDIIAGLGKVRAAQAVLDKERAEHKPTIALAASVYQNIGALSVDSSPWYSINKPGGALFLQFSWPLLDGGRRDTQVRIAGAEVSAANEALEHARQTAAKEVADAYYGLTTALAEHDAALTLTAAARTSYAGALGAYRNGVGTYTSLSDEENALVQAETQLEDARADAQTAASALAFATGSYGLLAKAGSLGSPSQ